MQEERLLKQRTIWYLFTILLLITAAVACTSAEDITPEPPPVTEVETAVPASPTPIQYPQTADEIDFITIAIDAPSRWRNFADIDQFGRVQGFDPDVMANLAAQTGINYEFVVTGFDGILASVANGEFDAAMSAIIINDNPPEGITFTNPYLEVGQVLVVRANETAINSYQDLPAQATIGIIPNSSGAATAREAVGVDESNLREYESVIAALQALIDREIDGAIIDNDDAEQYAENYYQQIKIAGGATSEAWITSKAYGIAVASANQALLDLLNNALAEAQTDGTITRLTRAWLIEQEEDERIIAGESLIGTLDNEFVIGLANLDINMDPAAEPEPISWELKLNTMAGLMMVDANNELVPILAESLPTISADKREYTFRLRSGLTFPDGSEFTAEDVKWSINRSARLGNFLVNAFLKDANVDGFADDDAVVVVDPQTVTLILDEPTSYFLSVLATPPYYIVSDNCYPAAEDPNSSCGGIGPYNITSWRPGEQMRLKANPQWPGTPPNFENVQVRFYDSSELMRSAIEIESIDVAWIGLSLDDTLALSSVPAYKAWSSPATFKSYLVFEQDTGPWNIPQVRQAVSYAVDREALSALFDGTRLPLYSPVPDQVPGHIATESTRDLERARELLALAGYTPESPLFITISYVSDGRYSPREELYANLLKEQLEETNVFRVTLEGAPYDTFRQQSATCNSPAFILGWPPSGQPPSYNDPSHWINYFVFNTNTICSNYESAEMSTLLTALDQVDPNDTVARNEIYAQIQTLWAEEYPTLDLTQEIRIAISLSKVQQIRFDSMGLVHYDAFVKGGANQ